MRYLSHQSLKLAKIIYRNFHSNLPGANELIQLVVIQVNPSRAALCEGNAKNNLISFVIFHY